MRRTRNKKGGVILLFVVVILTAIFSISIGVFGVILGQVRTSETFESSYIAVYAADQAVERTLYRDRHENEFHLGTNKLPDTPVTSGGCMTNVTIVKNPNPNPPPPVITQITATGLSTPCPPPITERSAARAFQTTY